MVSIYCDREDIKKIEEEERVAFLKGALLSLGIPIDLWVDDMTPEAKIEFVKFLEKYRVEIIHDGDRGYSVYGSGELIAEWKKPRAILKKDPLARSRSKKFYYELVLDYWSLFEGEENGQDND